MVLDFGHLRLNNDQYDVDEARRQAAAADPAGRRKVVSGGLIPHCRTYPLLAAA